MRFNCDFMGVDGNFMGFLSLNRITDELVQPHRMEHIYGIVHGCIAAVSNKQHVIP